MKYRHEIVTAYFVECGLPKPEFEIRHIPERKFRLDIGWPKKRVGIEVQGGLWIAGRHSRGAGYKKDMEKRNLQHINGWRVIEVEPKDLCTIETVELLKQLLSQK